MQNSSSDIFIIGGGINGVGIAADAAGRGLSVTLCEKSDLASGTSSASSKLIHGGIRYLETYEFGLVRKALREREVLLRKAPNIIEPLEFILPHEKHLRPAWLIRIGLFLYDHLAAHPLLPNSKKIDLRGDPRGEALQENFKTGFSYYDCWDDDARLVALNAISAKENSAKILTRTQCVLAEYENNQWKIQLENLDNGEKYFCYAKVLVNAAGPWVEEVHQKYIRAENGFSIELIKGSHIVVPKIYAGNFAYILQNPDQRVVFAIPYEDEFTLIGTTDIPYTDNLDKVKISVEETNYLCETINRFFKKSIAPKDVVWAYSGVRCLRASSKDNPSKITRDYELQLHTQTPLLTVISGKITTYRVLAEEAVEKLRTFFPDMRPSWTADSQLPGGDFAAENFENFFKQFHSQYSWLPEKIARRYAHAYGTRAEMILQNAKSLADMGRDFSAGLYEKEVEYLVQHEWARTSEDILWRRSKLGLFFSEKNSLYLTAWLQTYVQNVI
jgi:glycerol-3-phosphate dehydrogenase